MLSTTRFAHSPPAAQRPLARAVPPLLLLTCLLAWPPAAARAQTKGQLSYNSDKDAGYLILRGRNDNNACRLSIDGSDNTRGFLELLEDGDLRAYLYVDGEGQGGLKLYASNDESVAQLTIDDDSENGTLTLKERGGTARAVLKVDAEDQGYLVLDGSDDAERVRLSIRDGDDTGFLTLSGSNGDSRAELAVDGVGQGYLVLDGSDNTQRARLGVDDEDDTGFLTLRDADGLTKADLRVDSVGQGYLVLDGQDNTERVRLSVRNVQDTGFLTLSGPDAIDRAELGVDGERQGFLTLDGEDGGERVRLAVRDSDDTGFLKLSAADGGVRAELSMSSDGRGILQLDNSADVARARLSVDEDDLGLLQLAGAEGDVFVSGGAVAGNRRNRGALRVFGQAPAQGSFGLRGELVSDEATSGGRLTLYDSVGYAKVILDGETGTISKSGVNGFLIPHPTDRGKEIFYASLEGPEAGIYARGTATLSAGRATVALPEHFALVADPATVTVQLTPRSADTHGLAAVERSARGISVVELAGGKGSFAFDYTVTAARLDVEPFEPIRQRTLRAPLAPKPLPAVPPALTDRPAGEGAREPAVAEREEKDAGEDGRPGIRLRDAIDLEPVREAIPAYPDLGALPAPGSDRPLGEPRDPQDRRPPGRTPRRGGES